MTIRVLIVDDSRFICHRIQEILEEDPAFQVVGTAGNGREAVEKALVLKPDVITMDVEMPVMDGITAVKQIMAKAPAPVLMFSAMTQIGAQATLDALNAGAVDFLPKNLQDIDNDKDIAKYILRRRIKVVASQVRPQSQPNTPAPDRAATAQTSEKLKPDLLLIAASTGGPVAVQQVLQHIPANHSMSVLIIQHMPGSFTQSFAKRLDTASNISVSEAKEGDELKAGHALVCPGGMQAEIVAGARGYRVALRQKQPDEIYAPCVDTTFTSVAKNFNGKVLAVVLTGMGADGKQGAQQLKHKKARIWAQDEASSIIYGMPKAIAEAGLADNIMSLEQIGQAFKNMG